MKRILLMVFRNIFRVVPMWCKLCYMAAHPDKYTDEQHNKMFKYIVKRANIGGNVTIKSSGVENIPKEIESGYYTFDFFKTDFSDAIYVRTTVKWFYVLSKSSRNV